MILKSTNDMKVGFNCQFLDYAGHVTMLKMERELCDWLIVALQVETIDSVVSKTNPLKVFMNDMFRSKVEIC